MREKGRAASRSCIFILWNVGGLEVTSPAIGTLKDEGGSTMDHPINSSSSASHSPTHYENIALVCRCREGDWFDWPGAQIQSPLFFTIGLDRVVHEIRTQL
ncbi:hypothetical protein CC1G_14251 [Coprinopsis cinerea okayama7|uniref:Uncharacterized protein n=1 Tax=Coprinopsis cinerea (strain Okayama-7 / 130 / ATCC MYA-4618 / FGSC 9003) TaxID=240176 RepID=D6RLQ8_COPC7|nr:hypothetical protein CC1G_14251 [Coprinopsis cinerea okayama7\|eukprot:XP_002911720.1 hypothetical protein CC1G_14251 [Coprinopsis cinerea okayama7\